VDQGPARARRFSLRLPVRYRPVGKTGWSEGTTENISRSGVLFRTAEILEVDTPIEMRVALPVGSLPEMVCTGRIVRTVSPSGYEGRPGVAAAITHYRLNLGLSTES
jgi:hypothetical protein